MIKCADDVCLQIISICNDKGLHLKTYRNQALVSRKWRTLAIESIKIIDIDELMVISKYRKWSLLAQILCDYHIHRFPNLQKLRLTFPNNPRDRSELYEKMKDPISRNIPRSFFSKDNVRNYIDDGVEQSKMDFMNIDNTSNILIKLGSAVSLLGTLNWYKLVDKSINKHTDLTYMDLHESINKNLHQSFGDLRSLTTLVINVTHLDVSPLLKCMPNLQHLFLNNSNCRAVIEDIDQLHNLETLVCFGKIEMDNLENWKKLSNIKRLTIIFQHEDVKQHHEILESMVNNLLKLEILAIHTINHNLTHYINKINKLKELELLSCSITKNDLIILSSNLELKIIKFTMSHPLIDKFKEMGDYYTQKLFEDFKSLRPDVEIIFSDCIKLYA